MARVLIIEEQEKVRRSLVSAFKREGFETCDGTEWSGAAELFAKNAYDLIVFDLGARTSEGYDMLKTIKFTNSDAELIAIISPDTYDTGRMSGCGVYDCILKPFRQKDVVRVGKRALEKKQLADKVRNLEQIMDMNKIILKGKN